MNEASRVSAVILAAGSSTRMGVPKQLLQLDGKPLLEHVLAHVRESQITEIVLVLGHAAETIRKQIQLRETRVVTNENYPDGMGSSLQAGISAVDAEAQAAVIVLADQPFVRASTLDKLISEHTRSGAQIVIPTFRGFRGNPVLLDRSMFREVMRLRGDVGCRAIFGNHLEGIVKLPVEDPGILLDMDRLSDYEKLRDPQSRESMLHLPDVEERQPSESRSSAQKPELIIVGREALAFALAKLAVFLQFSVTLADPLLSIDEMPEVDRILHTLNFSLLGPNPERYVVAASRGSCDEEAIEQALHANARYVALVANRKRGEEVLRALRIKDVAPDRLAAVRIPAGLEIGAQTPEEIALSIMAEVVAMRRKA